MTAALRVVMYHYIRDLPNTPFPQIQGLVTDAFRRQVEQLRTRYEMATLESAMAFWSGEYVPKRDLCLLTFDDGLKDHYSDALPILVESKIQGLFFIVTECVDSHTVSNVHKSHFLMAALGFTKYRQAFLDVLADLSPETDLSVDLPLAQRTYRWDIAAVASFKYLLNFLLSEELRESILDKLFREHLGDETSFARSLFLSWDQAKEMQAAGMVMGGHSHRHTALAAMTPEQQQTDLHTCASILKRRLNDQLSWPFSYPYGKSESFDQDTPRILQENGFACAFTSVSGGISPGDNVYTLRRIDTNSVGDDGEVEEAPDA